MIQMRRIVRFLLILSCAAASLFGRDQTGQSGQADIEALKKTAPKVFIDCGSCDIEYIKTEITFVNYVRDRKEADVHVLITTQGTGAAARNTPCTSPGRTAIPGWTTRRSISPTRRIPTTTSGKASSGRSRWP